MVNFVSNKSKGRISKRVLLENKARQKINITFGVLCFLVTPVLRFALLPYYLRSHFSQAGGNKRFPEITLGQIVQTMESLFISGIISQELTLIEHNKHKQSWKFHSIKFNLTRPTFPFLHDVSQIFLFLRAFEYILYNHQLLPLVKFLQNSRITEASMQKLHHLCRTWAFSSRSVLYLFPAIKAFLINL